MAAHHALFRERLLDIRNGADDATTVLEQPDPSRSPKALPGLPT